NRIAPQSRRPYETRLSWAPRWRGGHHPMGDAEARPVRLIDRHLTDPRAERNSPFPLPDLFRQSIYIPGMSIALASTLHCSSRGSFSNARERGFGSKSQVPGLNPWATAAAKHSLFHWERTMRRIALTTIGMLLTMCAATAHADVVTDWNQVAIDMLKAANVNVNPWSRSMAMVHVAMSDAINTVQGRYATYT